MRFYVPVGPRGVVFRIGMVLNDVMGGLVYRKASRRRAATPAWSNPAPTPLPGETGAHDALAAGLASGARLDQAVATKPPSGIPLGREAGDSRAPGRGVTSAVSGPGH
jgi:hypothetical protein